MRVHRILRGDHLTAACLLATSAVLSATLASDVAAQAARRSPLVEIRPGMVITSSMRALPKTYRITAPQGLDSAVITVRGENISIDFAGATLAGTAPNADPDAAHGVAIRVEGGRNVRIRNVRIRGYKIAVLARETRSLELSNIDAGYNWKPRLFSLVEHESLVDWLSYHHNDEDEWLRFGAGFYLAGVRGGLIRDNTVTQGMNGLLLVRSDSLLIRDNEFSFNSGLGIGLYRSSGNSILRNRIDFNVRGYSHGFYRRGQDSADLLLYEQSSRNVVAFNSATHGGDGLFLWAGQSTMDTGAGGANDNVFYGNDFSFAPANAMEATFSRNAFLANRAEGSDYGLWGGYSFRSSIVANCFVRNRVGIAIEHGQDNTIVGNAFLGDSLAIRLWADSIEPSDWGYPKHRDTRSRDYRITHNVFVGNRQVLHSANTHGVAQQENDSLVSGTRSCPVRSTLPAAFASLAPAFPGVPREPPSFPIARRDRSAIIVDDWGPFDWRSPKLWPVDSTRAVPLRLAVLGPPGSWRVFEKRGIGQLSRSSGRVGDTIAVTARADSINDWQLTLEYRGGSIVSPRGVRYGPGAPFRFSFARFEPATQWTIRYFGWSDSTDPRTRAEAFGLLLRTTPILIASAPRLDHLWYRPLIKELPQTRWAMEATSSVALPVGDFALRTITDDGVRVWVDGALVIDNWKPHGSEVDYAALSGGRHEIRVQFFQVDGWTELRLDVVRGTRRALGSPGPH